MPTTTAAHDAGEPGINGVLVDLWEVGAGLGGVDILVTSNTTANIGGVDGSYLFGVAPGTVDLVKIPASNFAPGGALAGVPQSSSVVLTGNDNNHGVQTRRKQHTARIGSAGDVDCSTRRRFHAGLRVRADGDDR